VEIRHDPIDDPPAQPASADVLYQQAKNAVVSAAIKYGLMTFLLFGIALVAGAHAAGFGLSFDDGRLAGMIAALLLVSGAAALIGVISGRTRAFQLQLEAQRVLLSQMQIELKARGGNKTTAVGSS
jgi:hypothetical protein